MSTAHPPLRHLALAVHDADRSARFYCALFGFRPVRRADDGVLMLAGPDGFSLALSATDEAVVLPPSLHFGFHAATPEAVRTHRAEVAGRGAEIVAEWDEPGYVSFKCHDPDGYVVEVAWESIGSEEGPCASSPCC
jgi:catechol 2,3-dioxygenase-like lactoylglutathione lyase family enzyme